MTVPDPDRQSFPLAAYERELRVIAESYREQGSRYRPGRLVEIAKHLHEYHRQQEYQMARVSDTIHRLQQQIISSNADRDAARADADKFRADADRLAQLTADNRVLDDADVQALDAVDAMGTVGADAAPAQPAAPDAGADAGQPAGGV